MISTIILFIEQEPYSNVLMNLNVNFRRVQQGNFMPVEGDNFEDAIYEDNGRKFQNSPIHLVFYEMIEKPPQLTDLVPTLEEPPQLSSMTWCKLNKNLLPNLPEHAFDSDLLLVLKDVTAQFVTKEKYQHLLFILGQNLNASTENQPKFRKVLELFNEFATDTPDNFKDMLNQLQFPFVYNIKKSLAENRHEFKDFFSCLTNIRCAVVEGAHHCEAACRSLQGYKLGDPIPLEYHPCDIPQTSTLFKTIQTQVYYCQDVNTMLDINVVENLQKISSSIAELKQFVVPVSWNNFFKRILEDINKSSPLLDALYSKQDSFYEEEVNYKEISNPNVQSNKIKILLHKILTRAIFEYHPCKDLLNLFAKTSKPTAKEWKQNDSSLLKLSAEPFQHVSEFFYFYYFTCF